MRRQKRDKVLRRFKSATIVIQFLTALYILLKEVLLWVK